jgi:hypothetical protein
MSQNILKFLGGGVTVLGFELRALHLLGRLSSTWTTPLGLFALVIFERGSPCIPGRPGLCSSYFRLPASWSDRHMLLHTCYHTQAFPLEMGGSHKFGGEWAQPDLEHSPPNLSPPNSHDYGHEPPAWLNLFF